MSEPPSEPFGISAAVSGARHVLVLSGELDIGSAPELAAVLDRLAPDAVTALTIDLSRLSFMDSTGLHALLTARELCAARKCEFALIPGPRPIQRVFELCGLLDELPFEPAVTPPAA
jgi:anti-sigma B factor antagonist